MSIHLARRCESCATTADGENSPAYFAWSLDHSPPAH